MEWFRDLALCIFGMGATAVLVFIGVLMLLFYRKVSPILDASRAMVKMVGNISECVEEEVAKPLAQVAAFVQGLTQAVNLVGRFTRKKRRET